MIPGVTMTASLIRTCSYPAVAGTSRTVQTDLTEDGHGLQLRRGRLEALCDLTFREI
jgi:hypothetical protein